jgi:hypothetical protein
LVLWKTGSLRVAIILWSVALLFAAVYYALPAIQRHAYVAWMKITYPLGWAVSNVVLLATYFLILTPIALVLRLLGRDTMQRTFEKDRQSYWVPVGKPSSYFRQF